MNSLKISIKNLGIIKNADLELDGLTIMAGFNDIGKSFISKSIFSIVKTINGAAAFNITEKYESVSSALTQVYTLHRQYIPYTGEKQNKYTSLANKALDVIVNQKGTELDFINLFEEYKNTVLTDLRNILETSSQPGRIALTQTQRQNLINAINIVENQSQQIVRAVKEKVKDSDKYKNYFDKQIIQKLFQDQINTNLSSLPLEIDIEAGETKLLNIEVKNNKTTKFEYTNPLLIQDVTLIDSPMILLLERYITQSLAYGARGLQSLLPFYYNDLLPKVGIGLARPIGNHSTFIGIYDKIKEIIKGSWVFSQEDGGMVFQKNNGMKLRPFNVATGIKSFGLIQMLLNYYELNQISLSNSIIIIDEPEVHLHPQWEILYAELMVRLSNEGATILISTHSPYFVEAVIKYSEKLNTGHKTKFYLGDETADGLTYFTHVTADTNPIFTKFAIPMQNLSLIR